MAVANSYKQTMNLPATDFPMRANLPKNEPARLEFWNEIDIYNRVLEKNKDGKPHVLHDGPPYANGAIHLGHSFNKILKDFVNKSHAQRGFYTPYIPGWDCHGQPIEHMVEETLGPEKMAQIDIATLRRLCRDWATKYVNVQRDGFKRLGVNADWDHPYLTYSHDYEAGNVEIFKDMYLKGSIYRGRKPIHWCANCHTALAEAEIEYGDEVSPSIFVNFKLVTIPAPLVAAGVTDPAYILIWTTTPWTLPANTAVSLAPDADYVMVRANGFQTILAYDLLEDVARRAGWEEYELVRNDQGEPVIMKGKELAGITYICPIRQDLTGTVIYGNHVTLDSGSGAVHTAPGHGQDDYLVALQFDIPMLMPVDDNGVLTDEAAQFAGLNVNEANPEIIAWLESQGTLVAKEDIEHSYPHCWRCHNPVIFRATDQWFVSMDKNDLRQRALKAIEEDVEWIPAWAKNRIGSMVADRPDWCISRQRSWGVPIPVFKCDKCGSTVANEATFDAVIKLFEDKGSDAWFEEDPKDYLPAGTHCEVCGCTDVVPERDILDVWWESGVSHTSVCRKREQLHAPAEMYLEGSDQHRGWFQSSLLTSIGAYGVAPYKSVMHCGFTVDGEGRKMSKSLGNGVDPADVIKDYGADILRLWVSSVDYSQDVSMSEDIIKRVADAYRRIRNTFRFLLGVLNDYSEDKAVTDFDQLSLLDQWALARVAKLRDDVTAAYEGCKFHHVYRLVYDYIVGDLSAVYLDALKDRLYSEAPDSQLRRSAQTVIMDILEVLVRVMAPVLSFTTEEVWQNYPKAFRVDGRPVSVQLAGWPERSDLVPALPAQAEESLFERFEKILALRDAVTKSLEDARVAKTINKSQEAFVTVAVPADALSVLEALPSEFYEELLIVSGIEFTQAQGEEVEVEVRPSDKDKCPRCWNHRDLGVNPSYPDVCERCATALDAIGFAPQDGEADGR